MDFHPSTRSDYDYLARVVTAMRAHNGYCVAATDVGVPIRAVIFDKHGLVLNPALVESSPERVEVASHLVHVWINVTFIGPLMQNSNAVFKGYPAECIQLALFTR